MIYSEMSRGELIAIAGVRDARIAELEGAAVAPAVQGEPLITLQIDEPEQAANGWELGEWDVEPNATAVEAFAKRAGPGSYGLYAAPQPAEQQSFEWPKLERPAKVGAVRFDAGVSSRLVVKAAQRQYEYDVTPEKEADRIARLDGFRKAILQPAPDVDGLEHEARAMVGLLANGEWAGTHPRTDLGAALECQITKLVDRRATPDVSGLVEALETIKRVAEHPPRDKAILGIAESALAAHRKQGGDA
ncbi:hypothetical protein [Halopseudomonas bauzanensis]|uniref:Uncharacterized protein n=1 Tax=Halopseudomonas bauzanensis TaxID=653930 RepID=A0A4U0YES3_9GAMM|nr:hypothetical protein [Halopseudomonas bauzanensis]TKA90362.1 hypothetical protein FA869_14690 [Halopseudomonas bauzanensis]